MLCPYKLHAGIWRGRAFANGGAEIAAIAHKQQRRNRGKSVQEAKHAALPLAHAIRKRFEQPPFQGDPVRRCLHFVFWKLELAVADVFIREEFYLLEADDWRADENVAVGMRVRGSRGPGGGGWLGRLEDAELGVAATV